MFIKLTAIGIIGLQFFLFIVLVGTIIRAPFVLWVRRNVFWILRSIFTIAAIGSLVFEYVLQFPPCLLCWYQRIAIFGIAILLWTTDIRKSVLLRTQVIIFSCIGLAVALFHNSIDILPSSGIDVCGATGVSCLARYIYLFGYITIPMMSLTVLLAGLFLTLLVRRYPQENIEQ